MGLWQLSPTLALWPVSWVGRRARVPGNGFPSTPGGQGGRGGLSCQWGLGAVQGRGGWGLGLVPVGAEGQRVACCSEPSN